MVGRTGIEPAVVGLKGRFSTFADRTPNWLLGLDSHQHLIG